MATQIKVIHLMMDGQHFYFGSPKAMFDIMGPERMGMSYSSFHSNVRLRVGEVYHNRRRNYDIHVGILGQAKTNRSNKRKIVENEEVIQNIPATQVADQEIINVPVTPATTPENAKASAHETNAPKRKKKDKDIPEQLTLF